MDPALVEQDRYVLEGRAVERDEIRVATGFEPADPLAIGKKSRVGLGSPRTAPRPE